jgi:hypothetical protein
MPLVTDMVVLHRAGEGGKKKRKKKTKGETRRCC